MMEPTHLPQQQRVSVRAMDELRLDVTADNRAQTVKHVCHFIAREGRFGQPA